MASFHIQLLSDKNVVLVAAPGHESEIFLPHVCNNCIVLRNVIQNRRPNWELEGNEESSQGQDQGRIIQRPYIKQRATTATAGLAPWTPSINGGSFTSPADDGPKCQQFSLKLISNVNVVLVECEVLESEIFLPQICGHYIAMKRVTAAELLQGSCLSSRPQILAIQPAKDDCQRFHPAPTSKAMAKNLPVKVSNSAKTMPKKRKNFPNQAKSTHFGAGDQRMSKFLRP
ncbi:uncharacterized protein LOC108114713 [Drosophila eugracilis]|uniref:uncharacterized protein LOC108114713 n=1 Tax=Drosophila eugracilis TaxID=29029 RepID=UPI0007E822FE|nr:uncharacterized protein LOC108114713 [Drosophila eugracilis]